MSGCGFVKALPGAFDGRGMSRPLIALVLCAPSGGMSAPSLAEFLLSSSTTILAGRVACGKEPAWVTFGPLAGEDEPCLTLILMVFGFSA
jgi:hypothetical protein